MKQFLRAAAALLLLSLIAPGASALAAGVDAPEQYIGSWQGGDDYGEPYEFYLDLLDYQDGVYTASLAIYRTWSFDDMTALLAGDAENDRLNELLRGNMPLKCDILKVPHHGGYERLSPNFFQACGAAYAVITSSDEEPESAAVVSALERAGATVLLTRNGAVTLHSDGTGITIA